MNTIFDKYVQRQKIIGIGTGSTIQKFVSTIKESSGMSFVPSSLQSFQLLKEKQLTTKELLDTHSIEIYFDSADYFDGNNNLIKGKGGALLNEKLMMNMSDKNVILVDNKKFRSSFDNLFVPIEIISGSLAYFKHILAEYGLEFMVREYAGKMGPVITEHGNLIIDVEYNLDFLKKCKNITGVVEHGLFLSKDFTPAIEIIQ